MKIMIICSKKFYDEIPEIKNTLELNGHEILLPNCFDKPKTEENIKKLGKEEHRKFKAKMFKQSEKVISDVDTVLILNFKKDDIENYIGGATFLEMYDAFRMNKKIYMFNGIPKGILEDEIIGFNPIIINGDLSKIQ